MERYRRVHIPTTLIVENIKISGKVVFCKIGEKNGTVDGFLLFISFIELLRNKNRICNVE